MTKQTQHNFDKLIAEAIDFGDMMKWFFQNSGFNGVVDNNGYFVKVSELMCKTLGYTHDEMIIVPFAAFLHPDDIYKTMDVYTNRFFTNIDDDLTNRYRHKAGHYITIKWCLKFATIGNYHLFTGHKIQDHA
jgi:PAS domain S-box-containing protein